VTRVRPATPTVTFIDQYCAQYRALFHNVRHFEQFTALHLGLLAETRHKSLPRLGKTVHAEPQALHHLLAKAQWSVEELRRKRLDLLRQALGTTPFILCLDETGDRKKGHTTDYVASQYIGNLHTLANGIVSVNAYGLLGTTTFPLLCRVFKPETRLKAGDGYKTKPQLAIEIVEELVALGFRFSVVLADSLYGESGAFISALHRLHLPYVVALRSNHGVWMLLGQRIRQTRWRPFDRVFTDGTSEQRFIRETIFGSRKPVRYYQITTDPQTLPSETTWDLMTNLPGKIEPTVGNTFGLRTWIERGFAFLKDPLVLASSVFVKNPERIVALSLVMVLCLLVYRLAEHRLREQLSATGQTVPTQLKQPTDRPTMRWIFLCFEGINLVRFVPTHGPPQHELAGVEPLHEQVIRLLGPHCRKLYELSA
jgi:SRSO17 transposase